MARRSRLLRARARRAFALADFLAGTLVLAGVVAGFTSLTRAKFDAISEGELHARGVSAVEARLDRIACDGLPAAPAGEADEQGFRLVEAFTPDDAGLAAGVGRVEARYLRTEGDSHGLYEVRVAVDWRGAHGEGRFAASTIAPLPSGAPTTGAREAGR